MESLLSTLAQARMPIPPNVMSWMLETCKPRFHAWTLLLSRADITDPQAWTLLWRDENLAQSAEVQPPGSDRYWSSNTPSSGLAAHVAVYLARPDVPAGTVARVRERFDPTVMTRLDLLRQVTQLRGGDLVCHEIAAEPPAGSTRGTQLGAREIALVDRYRHSVTEAESQRAATVDNHVARILDEDNLVARVGCAQSVSAFGIEVLTACVFGRGTVAPPPESADAATAEWLEAAATDVMQQDDAHKIGPVISAIRPILRLHRDPADRNSQRWWPRRFRDFGEAGTVPLTFSVPAEEGDYIIRKLGDDVRRYQSLSDLLRSNPDDPMRDLCARTA